MSLYFYGIIIQSGFYLFKWLVGLCGHRLVDQILVDIRKY